jgi:Protein of unknown function (DUF1592)/Protein of unknown function (DUF1588)/Protein of unknown function (DUF1585)/Protein of unknown function (DUF1587)/Protein of unknown function (DUF1595)/Planctomycete cytochrome C
MSRAVVGWFGIAVVGSGYLQIDAARTQDPTSLPRSLAERAQTQSATAVSAAASQRATLDKYCISCHNERRKTAGLMLDTMDVANVGEAAQVWERVVRKLRSREMPPPGLPRPDHAAYVSLASSLETALDREALARPNPGRPLPLHRLNRAEYTNAIRDLLALEVDGRSMLPIDDSEYGFDSVASVLSVSPVLLERYLSAARAISRLAVGDPSIGPALESRTYGLPKTLFQRERMSEDLPFGSRGGIAIHHRFPLDGEYVIKIRLQRNYVDYVRGLAEPHQLDVRLDGARIKVFTVGGENKGNPAPVSFGGNITGSPGWEQYALSADADLAVRFLAKAGTRVVGVSFVREPGELEGVLQPPQTGYAFAVDETTADPSGLRGPAVESVSINGPYDSTGAGETPSRQRIFVCRPKTSADEESCADTILSTLARRAYRRPVTREDRENLIGFYRAGRHDGDFEAGIRRALERLLVDPDFLFRIEIDPPNVAPATAYRISDLELASRLSFFIFSSIPDDELLDVAVRGKLKDPAVLEGQVRRMFGDARSRALVDNFASQWLSLRVLREVTPNPDLFPDFDENLREAFQRETELFLASQLRDDRSVTDLLTANYTFVNERLARHYQIPNVYGDQFRRVQLSNANRGGLLGQGSILTFTSYGNRTSPVLRGRWLLENILGTPPPPPPPNVPALTESRENGKLLSMRDRMEQHRKNPACATCHVRMDPLGFALENFDAIGQWRTTGEAGTPIDATGSLPDGAQFQGLEGLQKLLVSHREEFAATVTEKLLTYALGRGLEYYDMPAIRAITRQAASHDYRWTSLILGIVQSTPFQLRRSAS